MAKQEEERRKVTLADLEKGLQIDKLELDSELVSQPHIFFTAGELMTDLVAKRDAAKEFLSQVDAELYFKEKERLVEEGEKFTEAAIKMAVEINARHIKATDDYLRAAQSAGKAQIMKESFSMRSYMLRELVQLHAANYYETSAVKGAAHRRDAARSSANDQKLREGRRERSRLRDEDD